jgi:hypothetical protein
MIDPRARTRRFEAGKVAARRGRLVAKRGSRDLREWREIAEAMG